MIQVTTAKPSELEVGHIVQFVDYDLVDRNEPPVVYGVITDWYVDMSMSPREEVTHHLMILYLLNENRERIHTVPPEQDIYILGEMTVSAINSHQNDQIRKHRVRHPLDPNGFLN